MAPPKNERDALLLCIRLITGSSDAILKKLDPPPGLLWAYGQYRDAYEKKARKRPGFVVDEKDQAIVLPDISILQIIRLANVSEDHDQDTAEFVLEALLDNGDMLLTRYPLLADDTERPSVAKLEFSAHRLRLYVNGLWSGASGAWYYAIRALEYCRASDTPAYDIAYVYGACTLWKPHWFANKGSEWEVYMQNFFHALADEDTARDDYHVWLHYTRSMALFMIAYVCDDEVDPANSADTVTERISNLQKALYAFVDAAYLHDTASLIEMTPKITTMLFDPTYSITQKDGAKSNCTFRLHAENLEQIHHALGNQHADLAEFVRTTGGGSLSDYIDHVHATRNQSRISGDIASSLKAKYTRRGTKDLPDISFPEFEELWKSFVDNLHKIELERGDGNSGLTEDQIKKRRSNKVSGAASANGNNGVDPDQDPMPQDRYLSAPTLAEQLAQRKTELNKVDPNVEKLPPPPSESSGPFDLAAALKSATKFLSLSSQNNDDGDDDDDTDSDWDDDEKDTITISKDTTGDQQTNTITVSSTKQEKPETYPPLNIPDPIPQMPPTTNAPPLPPMLDLDEGNSIMDIEAAAEPPPLPPRDPIVPPPPAVPTTPAPSLPPRDLIMEEEEVAVPEVSAKEKSTISRFVDTIFSSSSSEPEPKTVPSPAPPAPQPVEQREEVTGRSWDRAWKTGTDILDFITTQEEFDVFAYYLKWAASMRYSIRALRSLGSKVPRPYSRKTGRLQDFGNYYRQNKKKGETEAQFIERNRPLFTVDMSVTETHELMQRLSTTMLDIFKQGLRHTNRDWNAAWERVVPNANLRQRREMYDFYFFLGEIAQAILPTYKRTHGFGYASPYVFVVPKNTQRGYEDHTSRATFTWKLAKGIASGAATDHFAGKERNVVKKQHQQKHQGGGQTTATTTIATTTTLAHASAPTRTAASTSVALTPTRSFFGNAADSIYDQMKRKYAAQICNAQTPNTAIHEQLLADELPHAVGNARYQLLLVRDEQMRELKPLLRTAEDRKRFLQQQMIDRHRCLHDHAQGGGHVILCNAEGHQMDARHTRRFINADNMQHLIPGDHPVVMHLPVLF